MRTQTRPVPAYLATKTSHWVEVREGKAVPLCNNRLAFTDWGRAVAVTCPHCRDIRDQTLRQR